MFLWTDERIDLLKTRWQTGVACNLIAIELGSGCTKNSVVGKAHRLNLDKRRMPNANPEQMASRIAAKRRHIAEISKLALGVSVLGLETNMCRWPVSDDRPHLFCGKAWAGEHGPYCADHRAIAYAGIPKKKTRIPRDRGRSADWPPFREAA